MEKTLDAKFPLREFPYRPFAKGFFRPPVKTDIHRGREALRKKLKLDMEGELSGTVGILPTNLSPGTATL